MNADFVFNYSRIPRVLRCVFAEYADNSSNPISEISEICEKSLRKTTVDHAGSPNDVKGFTRRNLYIYFDVCTMHNFF